MKEGYNLPFSHKPPLTRVPLIRSGYANPRRDSYLQEALHSLLQKRAVEKVRVQSSLGFYNRLFIVPKPDQKWRPILDLSALNWFLKVKTFKMETPESIRLSLQPGEWVTSLDFSDAYFHIPISPNSRKFLRFHFQNQTFQFRALPFGLSTAPMEFTIVVKEVKLMARKHPDAPIPGRLVDPGKRQGYMFSGHPNSPGLVPGIGLGREPQKIGTGSQADFQFCRLPVRFGAGGSQTYPRKVGSSQLQDQFPATEDQLLGSRTHVLDRPSHRQGEAGDIGSSPWSRFYRHAIGSRTIHSPSST